MIVAIHERQNGEVSTELLGYVIPPKNDLRTQADVHTSLNVLWWVWRKEFPHPDCDSQFLEWLESVQGWTQVDPEITEHTIEV